MRGQAGDRIDMLGIVVDPLTMDESVEAAEQLIRAGGTHQHVVVNAAKVVQASDDPELAAIIKGADLVNADGMSVLWAGRFLGHSMPERVPGIDFMEALLARAATSGYQVFFLGAREEVVTAVVEIEIGRHPGLVVAGYRNGYWRAEEEAGVVAQIAATRPAILLVAMSSPKKERFLSNHLEELGVPLVVGVGGSFDVVAGVTARAPMWMQRTGLEWMYRLVQEPRRMFKRYLVGNSRFVVMVLFERWRFRRLEPKKDAEKPG